MEGYTVRQTLTVVVTGDVNGDGKITLTDFVRIKSHLLGASQLTGAYGMAGDVSGDGKITLTDFVKMKAHLLGIESIIPRDILIEEESNMKKTVQFVLIILLMLLLPMTAFAATASANVTGPSTIRAGNTLTVAVMMNGTGLSAVQGEVKYDTSQLTFKSSSGVLANWDFTIDGSAAGKVTFIGIDSQLNAPISSNKQLFKLSFTVKSGVAAGAVISVTASKLSASDGTNDYSPGNDSYQRDRRCSSFNKCEPEFTGR